MNASNIDESPRHCAGANTHLSKGYILTDSVCVRFSQKENISVGMGGFDCKGGTRHVLWVMEPSCILVEVLVTWKCIKVKTHRILL